MCNLSEGIKEKGIAIGESKGRAEGIAIGEARGEARGEAKKEAEIILNMHRKGFSIEEIASITEKTTEDVKKILEK